MRIIIKPDGSIIHQGTFQASEQQINDLAKIYIDVILRNPSVLEEVRK